MPSWSSIAQKSIPYECSNEIRERDEYITILRDMYSLLYNEGGTVINSRDIIIDIHSCESSHNEKKRGEKFYRKRKVPTKKNKNYPTKPKDKNKVVDIDDNKYIQWEDPSRY